MSKDKQQRVTLKCSSKEECDEWTMAISERIQDTIQFKVGKQIVVVVQMTKVLISL